MKFFEHLERVVSRPAPFERYTSPQLWNDPHISKGMLEAHLDSGHDAASYPEEFIDAGVDWMMAHFGITSESRVCDFGCGPGLWTTRFAEKGAIVSGIDLSERSLSHAQTVAAEKGLKVRYYLQDYLECSLDDQFDLITMIHGDFSVPSPQQTRRLLEVFGSHLAETGKLLIEASSMAYFSDYREETVYAFSSEGFWSAAPHHVFTSKLKYDRERVLCDKYIVVDSERELEILVWMQCYTVESLTELLAECGLKVLECYSNVAGAPLSNESPRFTAIAERG